MNYGKIVEDSFSLGWKYKSLWIFGMFAGSFGNFNLKYDFGDSLQAGFGQMDFEALAARLQQFEEFYFAFAAIGFVMFVLHLICSPALIDGVNKVKRGGVYNFWSSYSRGIDFFFRVLGLNLLFLAAMIGLSLVAIPMIMLLHIFGALLFIPIFLTGLYIIITLYMLAERALVVRDCSIGDALEEAFVLFKQNFAKTAVIALIYIGLAFGALIVLAIMAFFLYRPVNLVVYAITENPIMIFVLAFVLGLPISIVLGGFAGTFFHSLYTLFYFGLVDPSTPYATHPPAAPAPTQTQP